jgi:hypothetical protein
MKNIKYLLVTPVYFIATSVQAACNVTNSNGVMELCNPLTGVDSLDGLLGKILDIVLIMAVPVLTMAFIWAGFLYVVAQGNPEKIKKANNVMFWTVIGAMLIIGAKVIQALVTATIGGLQ